MLNKLKEKFICNYLMKENNFKKIYLELCKSNNPAFSKWYNENTKKSATGISLSGKEFGNNEDKDIFHKDILRFNKQSMAFYLEVLPFFYEYILEAKIALRKEYTFLDIGARTGAGANLFGQVFADESWGYLLKLIVDTTDINKDWNDYIKLWPYINMSSNIDIFNMKENSYDICFCSHTIEHLDNPIEFVEQAKKISRLFSIFSCPYEEKDPIIGHHTVSKEIIEKCNPKYVKTYKSVNRWKEDLECVIFVV